MMEALLAGICPHKDSIACAATEAACLPLIQPEVEEGSMDMSASMGMSAMGAMVAMCDGGIAPGAAMMARGLVSPQCENACGGWLAAATALVAAQLGSMDLQAMMMSSDSG